VISGKVQTTILNELCCIILSSTFSINNNDFLKYNVEWTLIDERHYDLIMFSFIVYLSDDKKIEEQDLL